jgi:hypothetical protein
MPPTLRLVLDLAVALAEHDAPAVQRLTAELAALLGGEAPAVRLAAQIDRELRAISEAPLPSMRRLPPPGDEPVLTATPSPPMATCIRLVAEAPASRWVGMEVEAPAARTKATMPARASFFRRFMGTLPLVGCCVCRPR